MTRELGTYSSSCRRATSLIELFCEEYRAAPSIDVQHDQVDEDAGNKIQCPTLHLWGEAGPLDTFYANDGGPLGIWRQWAPRARARP
jgi:haloacetate dehalogenase